MRAKKSLGQHFLKSEAALFAMRDAIDPVADDIVLEIGPGHGELTDTLLPFAGKIVAIEKDRELIPLLKDKYSAEIEQGRLEIFERDVLDFDTSILDFYREHSYKVVGNIPYYITGAIIKKFLSATKQPDTICFLIQKEVAERIVEKKGKGSILSISIKVFGKPKIIKKIKAGSFSPPPKVDSAILLIENIDRKNFNNVSEGQFFKLLKSGFSKKRKFLLNNLRETFPENKVTKAFIQSHINTKIRAEDLKVADWLSLAKNLQTD